MQKHGPPQIFNTDQGSQFTCNSWIAVLEKNDIKISMDGKGRCMDNVFIERLRRSLKYECIFVKAIETGADLKKEVKKWLEFYNFNRPHSTFDGQTPDEIYNQIAA